jgi:hypothetical protein
MAPTSRVLINGLIAGFRYWNVARGRRRGADAEKDADMSRP